LQLAQLSQLNCKPVLVWYQQRMPSPLVHDFQLALPQGVAAWHTSGLEPQPPATATSMVTTP
jgi:hypothetical protein